MGRTRKIAVILVFDVVGYSRLAGADEDRALSRLRGLRSDLIDPAGAQDKIKGPKPKEALNARASNLRLW